MIFINVNPLRCPKHMYKLSIKDYLLLIHTFMCMTIFLRIIISSHQIRILSAGFGMAWNRDGLSCIGKISKGTKTFFLLCFENPTPRKLPKLGTCFFKNIFGKFRTISALYCVLLFQKAWGYQLTKRRLAIS